MSNDNFKGWKPLTGVKSPPSEAPANPPPPEAPVLTEGWPSLASSVPGVRGWVRIGEAHKQQNPESVIIGRHTAASEGQNSPALTRLPQQHTRVTWIKDRNKVRIEPLSQSIPTVVNNQVLTLGDTIEVDPGSEILAGDVPIKIDVENDEVHVEARTNAAGGAFVRLKAESISVAMPTAKDGVARRIVDQVSLTAQSGDFVAVMGSSGAGKTTFLEALAGRREICEGQLLFNGQDLSASLKSFQSLIGYVPQDDILHPELLAEEAVCYSARMRLPPDYSDAEIDQRVTATLKELGLDKVRGQLIGRPEKKGLSGGERKRVNIALELVADPAILFLDEPTSGLGADDAELLIETLTILARKSQKLIVTIIHQPAHEEFQNFTNVLILGAGGLRLFEGTPGDAYDWFSRYTQKSGLAPIRDPHGILSAIRHRARAGNRGAPKAAQDWRSEFEAEHGSESPSPRGASPGARNFTPKDRPFNRWLQWRLLLERYAKVKWRDQQGVLTLSIQPIAIAAVICLVFLTLQKRPNMYCATQEQARFKDQYEQYELQRERFGVGELVPYVVACNAQHNTLTARTNELQSFCNRSPNSRQSCPAPTVSNLPVLPNMPDPPGIDSLPPLKDGDGALPIFFLVIAACWFGTSNAAREIVGEQALYRRERMINLTRFNYLSSKFVLLIALCAAQTLLLLAIVYPVLSLGAGSLLAFFKIYLAMWLASAGGVAMGLLISSWARTSEAALAWTPILLIPQVVLGGRIVTQNENAWLKYLMWPVASRWAYELAITADRVAVQNVSAWEQQCSGDGPPCSLREVIDSGTDHAAALGFTTYNHLGVPIAVLVGMTVGMLVLTLFMLARRESRWKSGG